ncbi:MAG: hypothetical protein LWW85_02340, partial [Marinilabiliales bacterium]|nr:hypothetical protein [Marinilabiliales bacterium]
MIRLCLISLFLLFSFLVQGQTFWRLQNESGEELLLTLEVHTSDNTFVAPTRKDALKEMAGTFAYMLAKTAGKLKYPEIVHSEGHCIQKADTLLITGNFDYLDKSFPLAARLIGGKFSGELTDNRNRKHPLQGVQVSTNAPIR